MIWVYTQPNDILKSMECSVVRISCILLVSSVKNIETSNTHTKNTTRRVPRVVGLLRSIQMGHKTHSLTHTHTRAQKQNNRNTTGKKCNLTELHYTSIFICDAMWCTHLRIEWNPPITHVMHTSYAPLCHSTRNYHSNKLYYRTKLLWYLYTLENKLLVNRSRMGLSLCVPVCVCVCRFLVTGPLSFFMHEQQQPNLNCWCD